jgi:hypothetical protein
MENTSFRDILERFLREKTVDESDNSPRETQFSASQQPTFPEANPLFDWRPPYLTQKANAYPRPSAPTAKRPTPPPARAPEPKERELIIPVECLAIENQLRAQALLRLGATEIADGLSLSRLKKAHRRLAKTLHPDRFDAALNEKEKARRNSQFLLLQEAYEVLSRCLVKLSALAGGNESASAEDLRRRDAA